MRQYLIILLAFMPVWASAQIVEAVKWSGEVVPAANAEAVDSVRLTATIQEGWHMTLINVGDEEIGEEIYESPFMLTFAANEVPSIRYNSCNDEMCTAPEIYTYQSNSGSGQTAKQSLWLIFLLGLLGGLLAIFTPCVWPIIPMTVSFFLKRTDKGAQNAILYGLSIIVIYVGLGLLITVAFGASALNDLSTNAIVNIFFFLLLVVFALSFFGLFEITLHRWIAEHSADGIHVGNRIVQLHRSDHRHAACGSCRSQSAGSGCGDVGICCGVGFAVLAVRYVPAMAETSTQVRRLDDFV